MVKYASEPIIYLFFDVQSKIIAFVRTARQEAVETMTAPKAFEGLKVVNCADSAGQNWMEIARHWESDRQNPLIVDLLGDHLAFRTEYTNGPPSREGLIQWMDALVVIAKRAETLPERRLTSSQVFPKWEQTRAMRYAILVDPPPLFASRTEFLAALSNPDHETRMKAYTHVIINPKLGSSCVQVLRKCKAQETHPACLRMAELALQIAEIRAKRGFFARFFQWGN